MLKPGIAWHVCTRKLSSLIQITLHVRSSNINDRIKPNNLADETIYIHDDEFLTINWFLSLMLSYFYLVYIMNLSTSNRGGIIKIWLGLLRIVNHNKRNKRGLSYVLCDTQCRNEYVQKNNHIQQLNKCWKIILKSLFLLQIHFQRQH